MKYLPILLFPICLKAGQSSYTPDYIHTRRISHATTIDDATTVPDLNLPPPSMKVEREYTFKTKLLTRTIRMSKSPVWGIIVNDREGFGVLPIESILGYRIK